MTTMSALDLDGLDFIIADIYASELQTVAAALPADVLAVLYERLDAFDLLTLGTLGADALKDLAAPVPAEKLAAMVSALPPDVFLSLVSDPGADELAHLLSDIPANELDCVLLGIMDEEDQRRRCPMIGSDLDSGLLGTVENEDPDEAADSMAAAIAAMLLLRLF